MKYALVFVAAITALAYGQQPRNPECSRYSPSGACARILRPVCSGGRTFPNECELCNHMRVNGFIEEEVIMEEGQCPTRKRRDVGLDCSDQPTVGCPKILRPVCAFGRTFSNKCELCQEATRLRIAHSAIEHTQGECEAEGRKPFCAPIPEGRHFRMCTMIYAPVCDTNGHTHPNECTMCAKMDDRNEQLYIAHEGECEDKREKREVGLDCGDQPKGNVCPMHYQHICAFGRTFGNKCQLCHHASLLRIHPGGIRYQMKECDRQKREVGLDCSGQPVGGACPRIYAPICAFGRTFGNKCELCHHASLLRIHPSGIQFNQGQC